eukprot:5085135-Heterocapsa_arctica.AAC.1
MQASRTESFCRVETRLRNNSEAEELEKARAPPERKQSARASRLNILTKIIERRNPPLSSSPLLPAKGQIER